MRLLWGLLDEQRRTDRHVARNGKTCRALGIARHRIPRLEQPRDGKCLASCRNPAAFYLPPTLVQLTEPSPVSGSESLLVSLFCPPAEYRRKNILNALYALLQVVGDFSLALNGLSHDPAYAVILARLNLRFQEWGWMARERMRKNCGRLDWGMQLSFAESFNYVAAEHLLRGIPILASPMVPVMDLLDDADAYTTRGSRGRMMSSPFANQFKPCWMGPCCAPELGARARLALRMGEHGKYPCGMSDALRKWQTQ